MSRIRSHAASCPEFVALFHKSPELAVDPETAWLNWHNQDAVLDRREARIERHDLVKSKLQGLAADRQVRDQERWRGVRRHEVAMVAPPEDGVIASTGVTDARRELSRELTTNPN